MPEQRYEAARQTVGSLLSTTSPRIAVPDWQRSYSWESPQIEAFWDDLHQFDARYPGQTIQSEEYFLGSIVLVTTPDRHVLLDGQQRLATATILLSVLRDARRLHKADAAARLQTKYILDFDDATNTNSYVLTLNVYDRDFFRGEIQDEPSNPPMRPAPSLKSHALIRRARLYFEEHVRQHSQRLGGGQAAFEWNLRISDVLCNRVSVVAVKSNDEDNAASVFETLNDRGIGLSAPDLLRNLLLRRAPDDDVQLRIVGAWQQVLGLAEEASVDEYLRHFWVSERGDVKTRKLYRAIKDAVVDEKLEPLALSVRLAETSAIYRDLVRARDDDPELQATLEGIRDLGAKVLYPALLAAYAVVDRQSGTEELRSFARALLTLFVRYNVIGGRETTVMESRIYAMAARLRRDGDFAAALKDVTGLAPNAAEFVAAFGRASISRSATARYLLREMEHAKRRTQELKVEEPHRVHVEHIYPQTPAGAAWPNHAALVNRLGNQTLLARRLNTSVKNADYATKKLQAYTNSDLFLTRELLEIAEWDPAAIDKRQHELSVLAFDIWRLPGEEAPGGGIWAAAEKAVAPTAELPADQLPEVPTG